MLGLNRRLPRIQPCVLFRGSLKVRCNSSVPKPYYITTPIFYVNAQPHIGHLYTLVLTDVIKRYRVFMGKTTIMLTGTDEHGMKIQNAAKQAKQEPQAFCDRVSAIFRELPQRANVQYDAFIRTTSKEHKDAVAHFWKVLQDKGYIFKATHTGWYSVSDETFFPESSVEERADALTGEKKHHSIETGNAVEWTAEENYHFKLSAMQPQLLEYYRNNPEFVVPQSRFDDVISIVKDGLQDLSISRPVSRLTWGIPVPGDATQTIYVWLDALVNYLTAAGYPGSTPSWPADVHVIGKDIVRFHCIFWPAFLLAAGIPPPRQVLTHSHWTLGNYKMSKSRGNVVDPWKAMDRFGIDPVRYYLMRDGRLENDGNYSTEHLILRHNHELVNGLGNLVGRVTGKTFGLSRIIQDPPEMDRYQSQIAHMIRQIGQVVNSYHYNMSKHLVYRSLSDTNDMIANANAMLQLLEPWSTRCVEKTRREVIYAAAESARITALLLQPIMPTSMAAILDRLGVRPENRTAKFAEFGADDTYQPTAEKVAHVFNTIDDGNSTSKQKRTDPRKQKIRLQPLMTQNVRK